MQLPSRGWPQMEANREDVPNRWGQASLARGSGRFRNRIDAKHVIEAWRLHYSEARPHSSLDYRTPTRFKQLRSNADSDESIFHE